MTIKQRRLGKEGPLVPALGLGTMGMSEFYGEVTEKDNEESVRVLSEAIDLGCTFWDTADIYGNGQNERLLSRVLSKRRQDVFLCTKFAIKRDETTGKFLGVDGSPEYVRKCCDASLKRLGVSTIDLCEFAYANWKSDSLTMRALR
jgi:aryl-alcohol dehydrogenase-like predicted oxidoreductase